MADVDAAAVTRACEAMRKKQHAALDALKAKRIDAKKIEHAKKLFGTCHPVGKAALVMTVDALQAVKQPRRDPICARHDIHPSSLVTFGCFDRTCDDCISGMVSLELVAAPFQAAPMVLGPLSVPSTLRTRSSDGNVVPTGTSIEALSAAHKGAVDVDGDGWPEALHCGTVHALGERTDASTPTTDGCVLVSTAPDRFGASKAAERLEEMLGEVRQTAAGPEVLVRSAVTKHVDALCPFGEDERMHVDSFCNGLTLWARYKDGAFVPPLEDPALPARLTAACKEAEARGEVGAAFGTSALMFAEGVCKALQSGKEPAQTLDEGELTELCSVFGAQDSQCAASEASQALYGLFRKAIGGGGKPKK
ncbi:hypothetical protein [Chondromyces apiculatus]|nr:hypothetical protein [Chondromyces apiculatus]